MLPFYIKWLRKRQMAQVLREEGPASHAKKKNTPTMVSAFIVSTCLSLAGWWIYSQQFSPIYAVVLFIAVCCGLLDFLMTLQKSIKKPMPGCRQKFALEPNLLRHYVRDWHYLSDRTGPGVTLPSGIVLWAWAGTLAIPEYLCPAPVFIVFASFVLQPAPTPLTFMMVWMDWQQEHQHLSSPQCLLCCCK